MHRTNIIKWITPGTSYGIKTKTENLGSHGAMVIRSATTEQEEKLAVSAPVIPRKQQRSTAECENFRVMRTYELAASTDSLILGP